MTTWVGFPEAEKFPAVRDAIVYAGKDSFRTAVEADLNGPKTWTRYAPRGRKEGAQGACWQVDVESIPGVDPLYASGNLRP